MVRDGCRGVRPGTYKVRIGTGTADLGYRFTYAGGGANFDRAKTIRVRAGADTALGRQVLPHTKTLFTTRPAPEPTYARPLVSGASLTVGAGAYATTPRATSTQFVVAARAVDPITGTADDASPWAASRWDQVYGSSNDQLLLQKNTFTGYDGAYNFETFTGRRYVVVAIHQRSGYAATTVTSAATAIAQ